MDKKTSKIDINEEEATVLLQLLDIATKSWWLQIAQSALFFAQKVQESFKDLSIEKWEWVKKD